jgi:beta-N-acetylhexosaminidase
MGVSAASKHFPGHGSAGSDSHFDLPVITRSAQALRQIDLLPFQRVAQGPGAAWSIMSAHLVVPALDASDVPATLSNRVMTGILRTELGFQGVAISDDLGAMKAITDAFSPETAAVRAVNAGVDLLIVSGDTERQRRTIAGLIAAVRSGEISQQRLSEANTRVESLRGAVLRNPEPRPCA